MVLLAVNCSVPPAKLIEVPQVRYSIQNPAPVIELRQQRNAPVQPVQPHVRLRVQPLDRELQLGVFARAPVRVVDRVLLGDEDAEGEGEADVGGDHDREEFSRRS